MAITKTHVLTGGGMAAAIIAGVITLLMQNGTLTFGAPIPVPAPVTLEQVDKRIAESRVLSDYKLDALQGNVKDLQTDVKEIRRMLERRMLEPRTDTGAPQ